MTQTFFVSFFSSIKPLLLWYFTGINIVYTFVLVLAISKFYRRTKEIPIEDYTHIIKSNSLPHITFVVPIYNNVTEALPLIENVLNLSYRYKNIIVVNDGSTDGAFAALTEKFDFVPTPRSLEEHIPTQPIRGTYQSKKHPEILLIDKENGSKFDAMNAAINASNDSFLVAVDPDTLIDNKAFEAIIPFVLAYPDAVGIGVGLRIKNECIIGRETVETRAFPGGYFPAMQALEYLRSFAERVGWNLSGGTIIISGAFSILQRKALIRIGGYANTFAEDMEVVVRLNRMYKATNTRYRIIYLPDPVAWTEVPSSYSQLSSQRARWQQGILECIWMHKSLFFNPKYKAFGLFVFPFWVLGEALEPIVELICYVYIVGGFFFDILDVPFTLLFLAIFFGFNFVFTLVCILLEELTFQKYPSAKTTFLLIAGSFFEMFGYRQLTVLWRVNGFFRFIKRFSHFKKISYQLQQKIKKLVGEFSSSTET